MGKKTPKKPAGPADKTQPEIGQFNVKPNQPFYKGAYGWGFEHGPFIIVVYGPKEFDHGDVVRRAPPLSKRGSESIKRKKPTDEAHQWLHCVNGGEHDRAHVHAIVRGSNRETRFELMEHYKKDKHMVRALHAQAGRHNTLTDDEMAQVIPVINARAEEFIQLWREMYFDQELDARFKAGLEAYGKDVKNWPKEEQAVYERYKKHDYNLRKVTRIARGPNGSEREVTVDKMGNLARTPFVENEQSSPEKSSHAQTEKYRRGRPNNRPGGRGH